MGSLNMISFNLTDSFRMNPSPRSKTPTNYSPSTKPCHHSWGPCPKDLSHHSSRSSITDRARRRSGSPWGLASSSSSMSSPVVRKIRLRKNVMVENDMRQERCATYIPPSLTQPCFRATSLDHLDSSSTGGHKLCIYIPQQSDYSCSAAADVKSKKTFFVC